MGLHGNFDTCACGGVKLRSARTCYFCEDLDPGARRCVRPLIGSWTEMGVSGVALFFPLHGWRAGKGCPHCKGTGIANRTVRRFCWSSWPAKSRRKP